PGSAATTQCIGVDLNGATAASLTLAAVVTGSAVLAGQLTVTTATYNTTGTVTITPGSNTNSGACTNYPASGTNTTVGTQGATLNSWCNSACTITSPEIGS